MTNDSQSIDPPVEMADRTRQGVKLGAFLAAVAFSAVALWHFHDRAWWPADDGAYAHVASRVLEGDVLNRDVQDIHFGYVNFANAAALWLFGDDLVSLRYPLVAMGLVEVVVVFLLLAPHGAAMAAAGAITFTCLSVIQFFNPTAHWYCLLLVVATIATLTRMPRGARGRLETAGFLAAGVFLFRQLSGVMFGIGLLAYLLAEMSQPPGDARGSRTFAARGLSALMALGLVYYLAAKTDPAAAVLFGAGPLAMLAGLALWSRVENRHVAVMLARLSIGAIGAAAPLAAYHVVHGSIGSWINDTVLCALSLTEADFFRQASFGTLVEAAWLQAAATPSFAETVNGAFWSFLPLLPAVLGAMVVRDFVRSRRGGATLSPLPVLAMFYALVSLHYQVPVYLFYSVGLVAVALLDAAGRAPRWRFISVALAAGMAAVALVYHAGQPLSRGVSGAVAGRRIELVPCREIARCTLWLEPRDVTVYGRLVRRVMHEVGPEETMLAVPVDPELYYLTGRADACRFFNTALGIRDEDELARVLQTFDARPPRLVVFRRDDKYNNPYSDELMRFVRSRYELLETSGGFEIYRATTHPVAATTLTPDLRQISIEPDDGMFRTVSRKVQAGSP